ncbi:hypothetical protein [Aquimarina intermedia]|uniref:Membrane metalloprotease n=1 Tax=Aquimarina intermedia TaxID=350814 RepID=A0A5S5BXE6_9FLAO|nr:hypothetical protein [Aquimarina intermedia]TYP70976.1 hypothetical protein BD809_11035 [Aquimarina intermedia]
MRLHKLLLLFIFTTTFLVSCSSEDDTPIAISKVDNQKPLGSSARDLLASDQFNGLTVELISVKGFEPKAAAIQGFKTFLENRLNKPDGITFNTRVVNSSNLAPFTIEEIARLENDNRTAYNSGDEITVYIYFADGSRESDTDTEVTLGTAYLNTSIVIYEETLRNVSNRPNSPDLSTIENATLNHEFAHLIGLVDIGTPQQTPHEDTDSEGHCNVQDCLMSAAIEFGSGVINMVDNTVPKLDDLCLNDLRANGGK